MAEKYSWIYLSPHSTIIIDSWGYSVSVITLIVSHSLCFRWKRFSSSIPMQAQEFVPTTRPLRWSVATSIGWKPTWTSWTLASATQQNALLDAIGALEHEGLGYFLLWLYVGRMKVCEFNYYHAPDAKNVSELETPGFLGYEKVSVCEGVVGWACARD